MLFDVVVVRLVGEFFFFFKEETVDDIRCAGGVMETLFHRTALQLRAHAHSWFPG
jgi:hypothetical protein